jgi:hypothetical protein
MLGIGETDEVLHTALDLPSAEVDVLTIGQYLQPAPRHIPVVKYITPEAFKWFKQAIELNGIRICCSMPTGQGLPKSRRFIFRKSDWSSCSSSSLSIHSVVTKCPKKNTNESIRVGRCKKNLRNTSREDIDRFWKCSFTCITCLSY